MPAILLQHAERRKVADRANLTFDLPARIDGGINAHHLAFRNQLETAVRRGAIVPRRQQESEPSGGRNALVEVRMQEESRGHRVFDCDGPHLRRRTLHDVHTNAMSSHVSRRDGCLNAASPVRLAQVRFVEFARTAARRFRCQVS